MKHTVQYPLDWGFSGGSRILTFFWGEACCWLPKLELIEGELGQGLLSIGFEMLILVNFSVKLSFSSHNSSKLAMIELSQLRLTSSLSE